MDRAAFGMFAEAEVEAEAKQKPKPKPKPRPLAASTSCAGAGAVGSAGEPSLTCCHSPHRGRCAGARAPSSGAGLHVADLVAAAGGFRGDAYEDSIEVQRVVLNRDSVAEVRTLTARASSAGLAAVELVSRDRVSVRAIPNWQPDESVVLEGEFRFPGEYALLPGETLGELVDRVGGVTTQAFPYGAVYTAQVAAATERAETERFANEIRRSYASMALTQQAQRATFQELEQSIQSILEREALGRIAIDMPRILAGDPGADVVLSDGDKVFLPRRNDTVTVLGEVFRPGSFRFEVGQSSTIT